MLKYKRDTHHSIICCPLTHTSFFMVFSLSSASSIRLASMKSLYLSVITMKWNISVRSFPHADNRQKNNCFRNNLFFFCNSNYPVSALLSYHSLLYPLWFMHHLTINKWMDAPSVKTGSGSFRKKDLSRLLITFRSCHLCGDTRGEGSLFLQQYYKNNTSSVTKSFLV